MSSPLFEKLEDKIDQTLEAIGLLRLQIEDLEEKNKSLESDNAALKNRQMQWEQSLTALLRKLEGADLNADSYETEKVEHFEEI